MADVEHTPVLLDEALHYLNIKADGTYLDATGGLGGHSQEIFKKLSCDGKLIICDYHKPTVENLKARFRDWPNVTVFHERFSQIFDMMDFYFDGILADFGISSVQLSDNDIGIGFLQDDAPLDMRIDSRLTTTATDLLQTLSRDELADLFYNLGGEANSRKIAAAIVYDRDIEKFYKLTGELRGLCERVLGRYYRGKKIHPATKVFQALRIAVNEELDEIQKFLEVAPGRLKESGRIVLISFHEGEDRLVKTKFKTLAQTDFFALVEKKAVTPSEDETASNPRARSAKMRILERRIKRSGP